MIIIFLFKNFNLILSPRDSVFPKNILQNNPRILNQNNEIIFEIIIEKLIMAKYIRLLGRFLGNRNVKSGFRSSPH